MRGERRADEGKKDHHAFALFPPIGGRNKERQTDVVTQKMFAVGLDFGVRVKISQDVELAVVGVEVIIFEIEIMINHNAMCGEEVMRLVTSDLPQRHDDGDEAQIEEECEEEND